MKPTALRFETLERRALLAADLTGALFATEQSLMPSDTFGEVRILDGDQASIDAEFGDKTAALIDAHLIDLAIADGRAEDSTGMANETEVTEDRSVAGVQREIVFLDEAVAKIPATWSWGDTAEVVIVSSERDGLMQIAETLKGRTELTAIHIVSHGQKGMVTIGQTSLDGDTAIQRAKILGLIGDALSSEGDLLLYGCEVGQGETGSDLIAQLALLTGADVAASTDLTGSQGLGGDWELERTTGSIESNTAYVEATDQAFVLWGFNDLVKSVSKPVASSAVDIANSLKKAGKDATSAATSLTRKGVKSARDLASGLRGGGYSYNDIAKALKAKGSSLRSIVDALDDRLGLNDYGYMAQVVSRAGFRNVNDIAKVLRDEGAKIRDVADALDDHLGMNDYGKIGEALRHAGFKSMNDIAKVLKDEGAKIRDVADALDDHLGMNDYGKIGEALRHAGFKSMNDIAKVLKDEGAKIRDVADALDDHLGMNDYGKIGEALRHAGFKSMNDIAKVLKDEGAKIRDVADALDDHLGMNDYGKIGQALRHAGFKSMNDIAKVLKDEGAKIRDVADALDDHLGMNDYGKIGEALRHAGFKSMNDIAKVLKDEGAKIRDVADALDDHLGMNDYGKIGEALRHAGFKSMNDIAKVLKDEGAKIRDVADALDDHLGMNDYGKIGEALRHAGFNSMNDIAKVLKDEGAKIRDVADALDDHLGMNDYGKIGEALSHAGFKSMNDITNVLKSEGASIEDVTDVLKRNFGTGRADIAQLLTQIGYTSADIRQVLQAEQMSVHQAADAIRSLLNDFIQSASVEGRVEILKGVTELMDMLKNDGQQSSFGLWEAATDSIVDLGTGASNFGKGVVTILGTKIDGLVGVYAQPVIDLGNAIEAMADGDWEGARNRLKEVAAGVLVNWTTPGPLGYSLGILLDVLGELRGEWSGRSLNTSERDLLHGVFGNDIHLDEVKIVIDGRVGRPYVHGTTIFLTGSLDLGKKSSASTFIHEATHVVQKQTFYYDVTGRGVADQLSNQWGSKPYEPANPVNGEDMWTTLQRAGAEGHAAMVEAFYEEVIFKGTTTRTSAQVTTFLNSPDGQQWADEVRLFRDTGWFSQWLTNQ